MDYLYKKGEMLGKFRRIDFAEYGLCASIDLQAVSYA
jgi:hypothetical protein